MPNPFEFITPTQIVFGPGRLGEVGRILADRRCERPALVTTRRFMASAHHQALLASMRTPFVAVISDIPPHSSIPIVERGAEALRENRCDAIVAIGGGSVIDSARLMSVLSTEKRSLRSLAMRASPVTGEDVPSSTSRRISFIAVPTTAGSAAETNVAGGVADHERGDKIGIRDPEAGPHVAVLDPLLTCSLSPELTATTGVNAFAHCVEALYSTRAQPISRVYALEGVRLMARWLPVCVRAPDDVEARGWQQIATAMSGIAMGNSMVGLHHALCHALGVRAGLAHGVANAVMLPHALRHNLVHVVPELIEIGVAMGLENLRPALDDALRVVDHIESFIASDLGAPTTLSPYGVTRGACAELAAIASGSVTLATNPCAVSAQEIEDLYVRAL